MLFTNEYYHSYQNLPEKLTEKYSDLNFQNHCYLRIALDNAFQTKWDTIINRPAYKNLSKEELSKVIILLKAYLEDKELLLNNNVNSLTFRGKL